MKKIFKKILVLAVMLGAFTSYANEVSDVTITSNYVSKGNAISVTDASGEVIYNGEIQFDGNLTTLFDFTQLKNGKYTIEISKDFEIDINIIKVQDNIVSYINTERKTIYKPVVRNNAAQVFISKLALDTARMEIELYFGGELIHSETVEGINVLNRVYKLDETLKGNYTAIIKSNDRVFINNFRI